MNTEQNSDPLWDTTLLAQNATFRVEPSSSGVHEIWLSGQLLRGRDTHVYGLLGFPDVAEGERSPGVLLAHGGRGRADADWVRRWTDRGYVALALDLDGAGPGGRTLPDGMPRMDSIFEDVAPTDSWTYHGVCALMGGVSALSSLPQVYAGAVSLVGISMGGILACITASFDARLSRAVSIYGSGGFADTAEWISTWPPKFRVDVWKGRFDPDSFLPRCSLPLLFITGADDPYFPLPRVQHSASLVAGSELRVIPGLEHGHEQAVSLSEVYEFVDLSRPSSG